MKMIGKKDVLLVHKDGTEETAMAKPVYQRHGISVIKRRRSMYQVVTAGQVNRCHLGYPVGR